MATSAIEGVLWPGCKALAPVQSLLGGITVNKGGYHSTRAWLRANKPDDYSIQVAADKLGPSDEGSALDWTFKDAQNSDFKTIAKFSQRLYEAGQKKDPRAYPLREFQGNIDSDRTVEGWSYYRDHSLTTSDTSHLWHIHFSIWRKYINDETAMRSILSILSGEEDEDVATVKEIWQTDGIVPAPRDPVTGKADPDNPNWAPASYLRGLYERVDTVEAGIKGLNTKLDAILAKLP